MVRSTVVTKVGCLALAVVCVALVPATVSAQGSPIVPPAPVQTRSEINVTVQAPPPDNAQISSASATSFEAILVNVIAPTAVDWANDLLNIPDIIRRTPPDLTYDNGAVNTMLGVTSGAARDLIAVAIFALGVVIALKQRAEPGRLLFAVMNSLANLAWWHMGIDMANAINDAIAAPATADIVRPHMQLPDLAADPVKAVGPAAMVVVMCVVTLLLFISAAFRLGLIDVLIVLGPLGLLCGAVGEASAAMAFYSRYLTLSVGTLFSQVLIVVCLKLAPVFGVMGSGIAGAILGISVLLLARRLPGMLASTQAERSGSFVQRIATTVLVRRFLPL